MKARVKPRSYTKTRMKPRIESQTLWGYLFVGPAIFGFLAFFLAPMGFSLYMSFHSWDMIGTPVFVGFQNFIDMFTLSHALVPQAIRVTLYFTLLTVPSVTILSLFLAMLLNTKIKGISVFRTIYYIPSIVPAIAASALWLFLLNPMFGFFNQVLRFFGLPPSNWLHDPNMVIPALSVMAVWGAGNTVIIYLAGLQGIPTHLYEAATVDGASGFRKFINVTVPMISPVIFFNMIMAIIGSMQTFTQAFVMTAGGPNNASLFYALLIYRTAFTNLQMGYASAMAWFFFVIVAVLTITAFKISKFWVYHEEK